MYYNHGSLKAYRSWSSYKIIMELGPQSHNKDDLLPSPSLGPAPDHASIGNPA